jgi:hypothetical protein
MMSSRAPTEDGRPLGTAAPPWSLSGWTGLGRKSKDSTAEQGGSHWKITAADEEAILTIPAKRPIKPVYIRKLLAMIERRGDGETD